MKRLTFRALLMGCLIFLTYALLWAVPVRPHVVYASIYDKHERLAAIDSPRLIFVGGSGIALGLDSELVEAETDFAVINMGVNAGFGLRYMLDEVTPMLGPGDVVVIAPEYEYFYGSSVDGSQNLLWALQIRGRDLSRHIGLSRGQLVNVVQGLPHFMQARFMELLSSRQDPIYNRWAFNERGDFVNHLELPSVQIWPSSISQGKLFNEEVVTLLNDFERVAKLQHAEVVLLPPAVVSSFVSYAGNQEAINEVVTTVRQETAIPLLAEPADYIMGAEHFFDTVYHLNRAGRQLRSEMVVEDLLLYLRRM